MRASTGDRTACSDLVLHPQAFTRQHIRHLGGSSFQNTPGRSCFRSRKGFPKGTYALRLTIEALPTDANSDDKPNLHEACIQLESAGRADSVGQSFHVLIHDQQTLTIPLLLSQRSRICIALGDDLDHYKAVISMLPLKPKTAMTMMRRQSRQPKTGSDGPTKNDTPEQLFERFQRDSNRRWQRRWNKGHSGPDAYDHYVSAVEPELADDEATINKWLRLNPDAPLISLIMPTYNTNPTHLTECITSIQMQSYPYWQLCICDDHSLQTDTIKTLRDFAGSDPRIELKIRNDNGHICHASNDALNMAKGEYIALIDHDDVLPNDALYYVAKSIQSNPLADLIYSDEDKIDETGRRQAPHFKSCFNLDLLLSYNYISHLGVYRRSIIEEIGGFRPGYEGSQDYDLALRVINRSSPERIVHIPRVLYHWRMHEQSTAANASSKDYTSDVSRKAIQDFLDHQQNSSGSEPASVEKTAPNRFRIHWPIPDPQPSVELLIPTRDRAEVLQTAIESILSKTNYNNYSITIIDNQSIEKATKELFVKLRKDTRRTVRVTKYKKPFNFSAINNFAASQSTSEIIGLINNDVEVINGDWLDEMVSHCLRQDIGCVGAKLYYSNNTIQHGGVIIGIGDVAGHAHKYFDRNSPGYIDRLNHTQQLSAVTAACLLIRRELYQAVGGLNENDLKVAFNDVDFCLRIQERGYRNIFTPFAELYHHESISRGSEDTPKKVARFNQEVSYMLSQYARPGAGKLPCDPFYNPNLSDSHENFSINLDSSAVAAGIKDRCMLQQVDRYFTHPKLSDHQEPTSEILN